MGLEWIVLVACFCLATSLVLAWCLTAVRGLRLPAAQRLFPDSQNLLRAHIDFLLMALLLFVAYLMFESLGVVPPAVVLAAMCIGSVTNPAAFVALAIDPSLGREPGGPFAAAVGISFVVTTVGYLGAVWWIGRAAWAGFAT
ncbi:MAG: hypothetical protein KIT14_07145 [bacterium]|nr:hypothetical protein [bacterium]